MPEVPRRLWTLVLALVLMGCTPDLGREWEALDAQSSIIVFEAPGLGEQNAKFQRSYDESLSSVVEYSVWVGPRARHAKALVWYNRASPGYYFKDEIDPKEMLDGFPDLQTKEATFGPSRYEVNGLGRINYRSFGFDDVRCVMFSQTWGGTEGPGNQQLAGYYCADPGEALEEAAIKDIVRSLDLKT